MVEVEYAGGRGWASPPSTSASSRLSSLPTSSVRLRSRRIWATRRGRSASDATPTGVRLELDRFRGFEIATTGDGFLAMFDGAARAVRCAAAIRHVARADGLEVRAGVHSGEVERDGANLRGVAVHAATRIAALAQPGEVLVSEGAAALLEGSGIPLEEAGEHELNGLVGRRRLYRLA